LRGVDRIATDREIRVGDSGCLYDEGFVPAGGHVWYGERGRVSCC
jgi:hypothetical protein